MQSRVWYAHDLVVSQEPEAKKGESAVATAARQALESTKSIPRSKPRPRWGLWVVGAGLAGAAATSLLLPFEQDAAEPQLSIASEPPPVTASLDEAPAAEDPATEDAAAEKRAAGGPEQNASPPASEEPVQASHEGQPDRPPRVAGYTAIDTGTLATGSTGRAADVHASHFASAPAQTSADVGELVPKSSAPEIEVVEVDRDGSAPFAEDGLERGKRVSSKAAGQSRASRKPTAVKQSAEYFETGDCAMPPWAWRVFGFTEPVKKKPGCGS